ncbi:MAG: DUF5714 domain-containing protein, partial [Traorella sp.]
ILFRKITSYKEIPMHGPIHHRIDGACLLSCLYQARKDFDLEQAIDEMFERGSKIPGAICGHWGVCGAVCSLGAALSIYHETSPLSQDEHYKEHLKYTSLVLNKMAEIGGPRCCKRNAFLAMETAIDFVKENYQIELERETISCDYSSKNQQCIGKRCPFSK